MSLKTEFIDSDYRRAYAESFANTIIANQIRLMRGRMKQKEFADLVGVKQSRISAMEDENYAAWSTRMLKKIASAKDVVFLGRFVSFGELLDWSRLMSESYLTVTSFDEDPAFREPVEVGFQQGTSTAARILTFSRRTERPVVSRVAKTENPNYGLAAATAGGM